MENKMSERNKVLNKAYRYLNKSIWKASKMYRLNNAEILGTLTLISITIVNVINKQAEARIK